jgi:hypothetical protein
MIIVILAGAPAVSAQELSYVGWTLSGSMHDPYVFTGAPFQGDRDLYLWLNCVLVDQGISGAEADLTGTLEVVGFSGLNGVINAGTLPTLQLTLPQCTFAPFLAGVVTVRDLTGAGGRVCFSGVNSSRDCATAADLPNAWVGYVTDGGPLCSGDLCFFDAVSADTWGKVKALYQR